MLWRAPSRKGSEVFGEQQQSLAQPPHLTEEKAEGQTGNDLPTGPSGQWQSWGLVEVSQPLVQSSFVPV